MQAVLSPGALRRALSPQRLNGYGQESDRDEIDTAARYLWNVALAATLLPSLHFFEVTLRNAIYHASLRVVPTDRLRCPDVPCWLDAEPTLLYRSEHEAVMRAKLSLDQNPKRRTAGHLISKLGLGFWVQLCSRTYSDSRGDGPRLWPQALPLAFPYRSTASSRPGQSERELVYQRLHEIREFRNRVVHHEPIWDRNVSGKYEKLLGALGWMNPGVVRAIKALDGLPALLDAGPAAFRSRAERLLIGG